MGFIFLSLIIVNICVVIINSSFARLEDPNIYNILKISLYMLPLQFLVSIGYAYYYSNGISFLSYTTLTIMVYPISISLTLLVNFLFFKNHSFDLFEIIGIIFTLIGFAFFAFSKYQITGVN